MFEKEITIFLQDIDVFDALRIILDSNDLAYNVKNGVVYVMSAESFEKQFGYKFGQKVQTEIFQLENGEHERIEDILNKIKSEVGKVLFNKDTQSFILIDRPEELKKMIALVKQMDVVLATRSFSIENVEAAAIAKRVQEMISENIGFVEIDEVLNSISITDVPYKLDEIGSFIEEIDEQEQELIVETKILQITLNDDHINGVDWSAIVSDYTSMTIKGFGQKNGSNGDKSELSIGTVSSEDYIVLLEALETVGIIKNISDDVINIATSETEEVTVKSTGLTFAKKKKWRRKKTIVSEKEVAFNLNVKLAEEEKLSVTITSDDGDEVSEIEKFNKRMKDSAVIRIKKGDTIVMGGLYRDVVIEAMSKVPVLGDIPFLGIAFRNQKYNEGKAEVIVFLTLKNKPE